VAGFAFIAAQAMIGIQYRMTADTVTAHPRRKRSSALGAIIAELQGERAMPNRARTFQQAGAVCSAVGFMAMLVHQKPSWGVPIFCGFIMAGFVSFTLNIIFMAKS
jgi:hypothetical protein